MEYRKKCNVCGNIFCYTDQDISNNRMSSGLEAISAIGSIAGALSGNWVAARANQESSYHQENKIIDFNHCPKCRSMDLVLLSESEYKSELVRIALRNNSISINTNATKESLLERAHMFIQEGDWISAIAYCEHVLDEDPANGNAYWLKQLALWEIHDVDELIKSDIKIREGELYSKIVQCGSEVLKQQIEEVEDKQKEYTYSCIMRAYDCATSLSDLKAVSQQLKKIIPYKDSEIQYEKCLDKIQQLSMENDEKQRQMEIDESFETILKSKKSSHRAAAYEIIKSKGSEQDKEKARELYENVEKQVREENRKLIVMFSTILCVGCMLAFLIAKIAMYFSLENELNNLNDGKPHNLTEIYSDAQSLIIGKNDIEEKLNNSKEFQFILGLNGSWSREKTVEYTSDTSREYEYGLDHHIKIYIKDMTWCLEEYYDNELTGTIDYWIFYKGGKYYICSTEDFPRSEYTQYIQDYNSSTQTIETVNKWTEGSIDHDYYKKKE